jgi:hypothetical protein
MVDLRVATLTGPEITLPEPVVEEFQKSLRGELIRPGDGGYNEARKIWNANIDKHPALIARCMGAADVINAVNFARDNHLLVSVRGGGHNFPGTCVASLTGRPRLWPGLHRGHQLRYRHRWTHPGWRPGLAGG